jgi:hypothetical protein
MTLFANWNQVEDENIPDGTPSSTGAGAAGTKGLISFGTGDKTRDITVLVAGVRVAF